MSERVGYARCGPAKQDLAAQREILLGLDVPEDLAEFFSVSRTTVYRVLELHRDAPAPSTPGGQ